MKVKKSYSDLSAMKSVEDVKSSSIQISSKQETSPVWSRIDNEHLIGLESSQHEQSGVSTYIRSSTRRSLSTQNNFIDLAALDD